MADLKVAALPFSVALDIKEICYRFRLWYIYLLNEYFLRIYYGWP